jgi:hypothetical protein
MYVNVSNLLNIHVSKLIMNGVSTAKILVQESCFLKNHVELGCVAMLNVNAHLPLFITLAQMAMKFGA